jgi:sugar lactone lactonase YvrE
MDASAAPRILSEPRVVSDVRATLGEGLCWSSREQAVWSVDILEHRLYRDGVADGEHAAWSFDETISAVAERADRPGLAVTLRRGLALFDPRSGDLGRLDEPEREREGNRFNDGKCDARGRFWGGTMDFACQAPTGALY